MRLFVGGKHIPFCKFIDHPFTLALFWFMKLFSVALLPGMPDTVLYCSLQDPAAPCPSGYNTNKVQ